MIIGVDGCRRGWVAAIGTGRQEIHLELFPDLQALWGKYGPGCALLLIDMPIGLTDDGPEGRSCDRLARRMLSPRRHSSVFTPPCRPALYATEEEASETNFRYTGKKLSRQTINILPKMREVDQWLRHLPERARKKVRESHPEVVFTALDGGIPLWHNKKSRAGREERTRILKRFLPDAESLLATGRTGIARQAALEDDLIDALALGVAAKLAVAHPSTVQSLPVSPPRDSAGLPMEIFYSSPTVRTTEFDYHPDLLQ